MVDGEKRSKLVGCGCQRGHVATFLITDISSGLQRAAQQHLNTNFDDFGRGSVFWIIVDKFSLGASRKRTQSKGSFIDRLRLSYW